jgi:cobalamin biosynthesis Co2+ chelatase CbiK
MIVTAVLPVDYNAVWNDIHGYMEGAAKYTHGRYKVEDIKKELYCNNRQQLWIAYDDKIYGAVITEIIAYPQMKTLIMHFTGGIELPKWKDEMLALLRRFAKDHDCKVIESYGRTGWKRIFKNDGFQSKFMFYELPV